MKQNNNQRQQPSKLIIDPALSKWAKKSLFPEKVEIAKETLKNAKFLPQLQQR